MHIFNAGRIFLRSAPDYNNAVQANRKWNAYAHKAGVVLGLSALLFRNWQLQALSCSCFMGALLLDDIHKMNQLPAETAEGPIGEGLFAQLVDLSVRADTIFCRYFPVSFWQQIKECGYIYVG